MKLILSLLLIVSAWGQNNQPTSIYATLFSATAVSPQNVGVQNIGQIGHSVTLLFGNCSSSVVWSGGLQYSYDNLLWFTFGYQFTNSTALSGKLIESGLYPYVRMSISFVGTNCLLTGYYTGTIGTIKTGTNGQVAIETATTLGLSGIFPVVYGAIAGTAIPSTTQAVGQVVNAITCDQTVPITVPAGTTVKVGIGASLSRLYVCGFSIYTDGAAGISITEGTGATCGGAVLASWTGLLAGSNINMSPGSSPILRTRAIGDSLCIVGTGAGNISGMLNIAALPSLSTW